MEWTDGARQPEGSATPLQRVLTSAPSIRLAGPVPPDELADVEAETGLLLPPTVQELFRAHDGELGDSSGLMLGLQLMPVKDALSEWRAWQDPAMSELYPEATSLPSGMIREVGISSRWFPLSHDGSGSYIGVDLDPGPAGGTGQIISYGAEDDEHYCYAPSLDAFLERIADLLESGEAVIEGRAWRFPTSKNTWSPIDLFI